MPDPQPAMGPFPASDPGFAALPVDELPAQNADLIARIKLCYGSDRDGFERDVLALIRRYAAYVHLLPATADNYFSSPGGLLRLGLETAFFSLQGTDAHIFSGRSTISVRRQLEPRWRLATFIGGLCCELHRVLSHAIVTDADGNEWPAYLQPLADWLTRRGAERYFVRWRPNAIETRGLGVFALAHVVPADTLQFLNDDNAVIVPHLLASIGGIPVCRDHNVLDNLVRRSLALVIDRNLQANADRYGAPQFGSHLERYLVDALRRLATSHSAWVPNRDKSRVWFGSEGLFLLWPQAAGDVQVLLEADQLSGIPKAPETVLELLLAAGVFEPRDSEHATWSILPPDAQTPLEAVKLASAAILFAGVDAPPPMTCDYCVCLPTHDEAKELATQHMATYLESVLEHYEVMGSHFATTKGYGAYAQAAEVLRRIGESGFLRGFMQASAWGTPDDVLKTLEARRKLLGSFELATSFRFGGIPYAKAEQSLRLFAKEVLPVLKGWDKAAERRRTAA